MSKINSQTLRLLLILVGILAFVLAGGAPVTTWP